MHMMVCMLDISFLYYEWQFCDRVQVSQKYQVKMKVSRCVSPEKILPKK